MFSGITFDLDAHLAKGINELRKASKYRLSAEDIWKKYPQLLQWLHGHVLTFDTVRKQISIKELLDIFKFVLASHSLANINTVWKNNAFLHQAIQNITDHEKEKLLINVLASSTNGYTNVIVEFVDLITDRQLLAKHVTRITQSTHSKKELSEYKKKSNQCFSSTNNAN